MPFYVPLLATLFAIALTAYIPFHYKDLKGAENDPEVSESMNQLREIMTPHFLIFLVFFGPIFGSVVGFWLAYIISLVF